MPNQQRFQKQRNKPKKEQKDSFDNIVAGYKRKFMRVAADSNKSKKWYE